MAADRRTLSRLKKLLLALDVDRIVQGVELVASLDDPEIWDALLAGVDWVPPSGWVEGYLRTNKLFEGNWRTHAHRGLALALLVANAPLPLRDRVTNLRFGVSAPPSHGEFPRLPLEGLEKYPNLRELCLYLPSETDLAPLADAPSLEVLTISSVEPVSLESLVRAPKLRRIEVEGTSRLDLSSLGRALRLETLRIEADEVQLAGLAGSPLKALRLATRVPSAIPPLQALETLTVAAPSPVGSHRGHTPVPTLQAARVIPHAATELPALRHLALEHLDARDLEFLRGSGIERLDLGGCRVGDLGALGSLAHLREIGLHSPVVEQLRGLPAVTLIDREGRPTNRLDLSNTGIRSLRGIGELRGLQILILAGCRELASLEGIEGSGIAIVDLTGCRRIDPAALVHLPELRLVVAHDTGIHAGSVDPAISAAVTLARSPDLEAALREPPVRERPPLVLRRSVR